MDAFGGGTRGTHVTHYLDIKVCGLSMRSTLTRVWRLVRWFLGCDSETRATYHRAHRLLAQGGLCHLARQESV